MNVAFRVDSSYKIGLGRDNGYYRDYVCVRISLSLTVVDYRG